METIAAISTGLTNSGISIVRISGGEAITIADTIFRAKKAGKRLCNQSSHTIHYGEIVDHGTVIDEVLVSLMRAPHTYTTEDVVEIHCHGGVLVTKRVLRAVLEHGARLAEPGEFSKRAFLGGRMDLSQAEAVMEVIHAKSDRALRSAVSELTGRTKTEINELRDRLLHRTAEIESALDDPEHYSLNGFTKSLKEDIIEIKGRIGKLRRRSENGRVLREGIKTVILGRPNVGKSSLLNYLAGTERAIVTDIAGTTRDTIEETIVLKGIALVLTDTAGLRRTGDVIEQIGIDKAKKEADGAELILYLLDASGELTEEDSALIAEFADKKMLLLLNKTDLCADREEPIDLGMTAKELSRRTGREVIGISAKTGEGMNVLGEKIEQLFLGKEIGQDEEFYLTGERQREALADAENALSQVLISIDSGMPEDFYTIDLMQAYESLSKITGETVEEDLINTIFREFCMGK